MRRLLFNAAMQGRRNPLWEPYYLSLRARGMSTTAAFVALARKLARKRYGSRYLPDAVFFTTNIYPTCLPNVIE